MQVTCRKETKWTFTRKWRLTWDSGHFACDAQSSSDSWLAMVSPCYQLSLLTSVFLFLRTLCTLLLPLLSHSFPCLQPRDNPLFCSSTVPRTTHCSSQHSSPPQMSVSLTILENIKGQHPQICTATGTGNFPTCLFSHPVLGHEWSWVLHCCCAWPKATAALFLKAGHTKHWFCSFTSSW